MLIIDTILENYYCKSPFTIIHRINAKIKIYIIFSSLLFCSYMSQLKICYLFLIPIYFFNYKFILIMFKYIIVYTVYFIISINLVDYSNLTEYNINISKIFLPYYFTIYKEDNKIRLTFYYYFWYLPNYLKQIFKINILSNILIYTLFSCTPYETVIKILTKSLVNINIITNKICILTLFLSFQCLERLLYNIKNVLLSIKVKKCLIKKLYIKHIRNIALKYTSNLLDDQYSIVSIIWNRNLKSINFNSIID
uniref:Uncharacterized protein n=1 Tax=Alsidium seaforthii TaxID=2007182 RepID=A0A1Z1MCW2_9FLOR|nr:hypothetical protein [Bryothamnion seaforthii]ARW63928.1 hypothetical protein [Bryothamnion seaforthii]